MIIVDDYKKIASDAKSQIDDLKDAVSYNQILMEIEKLEVDTQNPDFWANPEKQAKVFSQIKVLKDKKQSVDDIITAVDDIEAMIELYEELEDESLEGDIISTSANLTEMVELLRLKNLLTGEYDKNNAIITLHAGAGGTESQDWCEMLFRMYGKYCAKAGYKTTTIDYLEGDEAGIKSVSFSIEGENAHPLHPAKLCLKFRTTAKLLSAKKISKWTYTALPVQAVSTLTKHLPLYVSHIFLQALLLPARTNEASSRTRICV